MAPWSYWAETGVVSENETFTQLVKGGEVVAFCKFHKRPFVVYGEVCATDNTSTSHNADDNVNVAGTAAFLITEQPKLSNNVLLNTIFSLGKVLSVRATWNYNIAEIIIIPNSQWMHGDKEVSGNWL